VFAEEPCRGKNNPGGPCVALVEHQKFVETHIVGPSTEGALVAPVEFLKKGSGGGRPLELGEKKGLDPGNIPQRGGEKSLKTLREENQGGALRGRSGSS